MVCHCVHLFLFLSDKSCEVLGLIIGALFVSFTTWPWVFYFITIVSLTSMLLTLIFTPRTPTQKLTRQERREKFERLDVLGVSLLTSKYTT